jgi:hypothetical protein
MASLTLKNLPEPLLRDLRKAADKDRRSLTQQIIYLLERSLREPAGMVASAPVDHAAQLAAWRKLAGKWESDVERTREAEAPMKRRTAGRGVEF